MRAIGLSLMVAAAAAFIVAGCGTRKTAVQPGSSPSPQASEQKQAAPGSGPASEAKKPSAPNAAPAARDGEKTATILVEGMT